MLNVDQLVTLAMEMEITDPIDWGYLNIKEEDAYRLVASGILEHYQSLSTDDDRIQMLICSLIKLTVENFVLNIKLLQQNQ